FDHTFETAEAFDMGFSRIIQQYNMRISDSGTPGNFALCIGTQLDDYTLMPGFYFQQHMRRTNTVVKISACHQRPVLLRQNCTGKVLYGGLALTASDCNNLCGTARTMLVAKPAQCLYRV